MKASDHNLRTVLRLYPRSFRERYGPELQDHIDEMARHADITHADVADLLLSVAKEHSRQRGHEVASLGLSFAPWVLGVIIVTPFWALAGAVIGFIVGLFSGSPFTHVVEGVKMGVGFGGGAFLFLAVLAVPGGWTETLPGTRQFALFLKRLFQPDV